MIYQHRWDGTVAARGRDQREPQESAPPEVQPVPRNQSGDAQWSPWGLATEQLAEVNQVVLSGPRDAR